MSKAKKSPHASVWLVETREESNPETGECKGRWYACGHWVHHTRREAQFEAREMMSFGPKRVVKYIRKVTP